MNSWRQLHGSVEAFERIVDDFARNSDQHDANWRRNLVDLRRELQDRLIDIRAALQTHEASVGASGASHALSGALSTMRSAIALHQAEWPAVMIDTSDATYRASVRELREATRTFRKTAHANLATLKA